MSNIHIEQASTNEPVSVLGSTPRPTPQTEIKTVSTFTQQGYPAVEQLAEFVRTNWAVEIEELPSLVRVVIKLVSDYVTKMDPQKSSLSIEDKARQQQNLYKAFINALNCEPDQSLIALRIMMFLFQGYKSTVFNDRNALIGIDYVRFTPEENTTFRSLMALFISTCNPVTRKQVLKRQMDLRKVINTLPTQRLQDSLTRFYSIVA